MTLVFEFLVEDMLMSTAYSNGSGMTAHVYYVHIYIRGGEGREREQRVHRS